MRVQLFGHPVPRSIVVLAMLEAATVFCALIAARLLCFHFDPQAVDYDLGSIWARGMLLTGATFVCAMAFGLYSGVNVRAPLESWCVSWPPWGRPSP